MTQAPDLHLPDQAEAEGRRGQPPRLLLAERAYDTLRDQITFGELVGGAKLVENVLAENLGMSRTPVREAIRQLERDGLVQRKGAVAFVAPFDADAAIEVMFVRSLLEPVAARLGAPALTGGDISRLRGVLGQMQDAGARDAPAATHARLNSEFHDALYARCSLERLMTLIRGLRGHFIAYELYRRYTSEDHRRVLEEHTEIVEAAQDPDPDQRGERLETLVREHLLRGREPLRRAPPGEG